MKITFFKKEKSFKKKNFSLSLNFYWEIAVCGIFLVIIFSLFLSYRFFVQINQEPILSNINEDVEIPTINKDRIEKISNYFSAREIKSKEIINSPSPVVDPSL